MTGKRLPDFTWAPRFCIQPDWLPALEDETCKKFWVSFYAENEAEEPRSIHGSVKAHGTAGSLSLFSQEFENVSKNDRELTVELNDNLGATFVYHDKMLQVGNGQFKARFLDVSPGESLALANDSDVGPDGLSKIQVIDIQTREIKLSLSIKPTPHLGRFLPSGEVIIFALHNEICLAGLKNGQIVRRFKGHSESVTQIEFIEAGRNFLSASSDGTVRLWECSSGEQVSEWESELVPRGPINCLRIYQHDDETEFSTEEAKKYFWKKATFALYGTEAGYINCISLPTGKLIKSFNCREAVLSMELLEDRLIAGCRDGRIYTFWRKPNKSEEWDFGSNFMVSCFFPHPVYALSAQLTQSQEENFKGDLYVSFGATGVALFRIVDHDEMPLEPMHNELTGADCEPIQQIFNRPNGIWTTSRDGCLFFYSLRDS